MEKRILTAIFGLLIAVLGWVWSMQYTKLVEIEKELKTVQIELVKMQSTMLTAEHVKEIVIDELEKRGIR